MTDPGQSELEEGGVAPTLRELVSSTSVKLLIVSRFFSSGSSVAIAMAAGKVVFDITDRELDLGFIGLAEFLPTALLVLLAGSLADRYDRRRIAFLALVTEGAVAAGLAWYVSTDPTAVWPIFLLVGLIGTARGFANPASRALPPLVAPPG
ncbi:MAG: MFS transporter, partial [Actinomycetota bacterium]|nr:MFS transporter [Actinomycetota bacterium]